MLLFSTILEINDAMTKDAFIQLVIDWNQSNPHRSNVIPDINWNGERNIRFGSDALWLAIEEYRNQNIIAIRHEKRERDGVVWDTDYVMNFNTMKLSIMLDRSYLEDALFVDPRFSTPHFITLLIERDYLKKDGELPVLRTPIVLADDNLELLSDIINGKKRYRLPVVYVSKTASGDLPVDVKLLASRLKGVAHVVMQGSISQNGELMKLCACNNEYNGAIGIYYSNWAVPHRRYLYHSATGEDRFLFEKVLRAVIQHSNAQLVESLYTWSGVNHAILMDRLASQREERLAAEQAQKAAEKETMKLLDSLNEEERRIRKQAMEEARAESDALLEGFDEDMAKLQRQVEELKRTNESLRYENQGLRAKLDNRETIPVLFMGEEYEFYQGEIKDFLLSVLTDALPNLPPKSRRLHVVRDIIANNEYHNLCEIRAEKLKKMLKNYDGMSGKLRQELETLGFEITEEGKHYKLTYYGDGRYQTVFAKTPSDSRAGKNNASAIINLVF